MTETAQQEIRVGDKVTIDHFLKGATEGFKEAVRKFDYVNFAEGPTSERNSVRVTIPPQFRDDLPPVLRPGQDFYVLAVRPYEEELPKVGDKIRVLEWSNPTGRPPLGVYEVAPHHEITTDRVVIETDEGVTWTAVKWEKVEPETPEEPDGKWRDLIEQVFSELDSEARMQGWCGEYEDTIEAYFGVKVKPRVVTVDVDVTLRRVIDIDGMLDATEVFGYDPDAYDGVTATEEVTVYIDTSVSIECNRDTDPDPIVVDGALRSTGYVFDDFDIRDWNEV